jgi:hypothetical protein
MADIVILAEDAPEVAVGQKDCPGTAAADQRRLLAEMGESVGNREFISGPTVACLPTEPFHTALPRTEPAIAQEIPEELNPPGEFSSFMKADIGRNEAVGRRFSVFIHQESL